jgi:hypothetical protein
MNWEKLLAIIDVPFFIMFCTWVLFDDSLQWKYLSQSRKSSDYFLSSEEFASAVINVILVNFSWFYWLSIWIWALSKPYDEPSTNALVSVLLNKNEGTYITFRNAALRFKAYEQVWNVTS